MHTVRLAKLLVSALVPALVLAACGGDPKGAAAPSAQPADAGADASGSARPLPFGSTTVPMAQLPPSFRYSSKKAKKQPSARCGADASSPGGDPALAVQKWVTSCEGMAPLGAPIRGTQTQGAPAQNIKLSAEAGRCYRVFVAGAPAIKNLIVVVTDSAGAVVWESRTEDARLIVPDDGALCFETRDEAQISVSVGSGEGAYVVQLASIEARRVQNAAPAP